MSAAPIGDGGGDSFTIAGYGTADESAGGGFGALRQANLVAASRGALVDPFRQGDIGASACFGDSGGPVMRGGMLVGVITRAAYPNRRIACGNLTRWAPVTVTGSARAAVPSDDGATLSEPRRHKHSHRVRHKRHTRHKTARRLLTPQSFSDSGIPRFRGDDLPATPRIVALCPARGPARLEGDQPRGARGFGFRRAENLSTV